MFDLEFVQMGVPEEGEHILLHGGLADTDSEWKALFCLVRTCPGGFTLERNENGFITVGPNAFASLYFPWFDDVRRCIERNFQQLLEPMPWDKALLLYHDASSEDWYSIERHEVNTAEEWKQTGMVTT